MDNNKISGGESLGSTLLLTLFIGLKLGHVIDWSWWWVLSPLWIPLGILGIVLLVCLLLTIFENKEEN